MTASVTDLLQQARAAGLELLLRDGQIIVRGPTELRARWMPLLREHRDELLGLLAEGASATPDPSKGAADPGTPPDHTCASCSHRTRAGTCGRPVEAGLADHFAIRWPPAGHAARCPAFERQPQPAEPLRHPYDRERRAWTPATEAEVERMAATFERATALGFAPDEADRLADVVHWAARLGDTRPCICCAHLRSGTTSRWWCAAQRQPLPLQFVTGPHRCPTFREVYDD